MQLFNGLNIGILNYCKVNFNVETDAGNDGIEGNVNYEEELQKVKRNIDALKDSQTDNDDNAKTELNASLSDKFCSGINDYLKNKETEKDKLTVSLQAALQKYPNEASLQKLKIALGLDTQSEGDPSKDAPKLDLKGELFNISVLEDGANTTGKFYSKLVENKPEGGDESDESDNSLNLRKTKELLDAQLTNINELQDKNAELKNDENLKKSKQLIENIWKVIKNPIEPNVKILQEFISNNLDGEDKNAFDKKSKRGENFDGKFGKGTLQGLNIILGKTNDYINNMKTYQEALNKKENEEKLDKIAIKDNPTISKIDNTDNIDLSKLAKELINLPEDLPEGVSTEFELSDQDKGKLKTAGTYSISLTVKIGNESKVFKINVTVTENTNESENDSNTPTDTTPLKINDNLGNENTYLVMQNSQQLAGKIGITGVTFYSSNNFAGKQPSEGQNWPTARADTDTLGNNSDYECLMKLSNNPDNIYKVKIDRNGNLCPTAQYFNSKRPVFFEYNTSCENYLRGKLPDVLKNNNRIKFGWNGKVYTIGLNGFDKNLTIEPMTIDGYRLGDGGKNNGATLEESLAFLNLTNYLRNQKDLNNGIKFKNDNPNLKLDDDKLKVRVNKKKNSTPKENGKYENQGKRYTIDKASFGITEREEILERFIKYNNGEHREDNWNRKNPNKEYKLIKIQ